MSNNKLLNVIPAAAVLMLVFLVAFTLTSGASIKNTMYGFSLMVIYFLLLASYLSRIAFVLFGVFAVYKILQERIRTGDATR